MIAFNSSGDRPVLSSTSTPLGAEDLGGLGIHLVGDEHFGHLVDSLSGSVFRRRAGTHDTTSEISRSGVLGPGLRRETMASACSCIGPVEPGPERLDVGGVDGGAAPDAQARRRVAIAGDVVGRALASRAGRRIALISACVRALDRQADAGLRAAGRIGGEMAEPVALGDDPVERRGIGVGAGDQAVERRRAPSPIRARRSRPRPRASRAC